MQNNYSQDELNAILHRIQKEHEWAVLINKALCDFPRHPKATPNLVAMFGVAFMLDLTVNILPYEEMSKEEWADHVKTLINHLQFLAPVMLNHPLYDEDTEVIVNEIITTEH